MQSSTGAGVQTPVGLSQRARPQKYPDGHRPLKSHTCDQQLACASMQSTYVLRVLVQPSPEQSQPRRSVQSIPFHAQRPQSAPVSVMRSAPHTVEASGHAPRLTLHAAGVAQMPHVALQQTWSGRQSTAPQCTIAAPSG
jgi:hypothetical protein